MRLSTWSKNWDSSVGAGKEFFVDLDVHGEDIVLIEARVHGLEAPEAAEHQSGADEENKDNATSTTTRARAGCAASTDGVGTAETLLQCGSLHRLWSC